MTPADNHRWVKTVTLVPPSLADNSADAGGTSTAQVIGRTAEITNRITNRMLLTPAWRRANR